MNGARGMAELVAAAFTAGVVDRLAVLAAADQAADRELPEGAVAEPGLVTANPLPPELVQLEDWPFVSVVPARTPLYRRTDAGAGADTYLVTYEMRALVWATGPGYAETSAGRDRLVQALVELLLTEGSLGPDAAVLRETISVDWSPIGMDEDLEALVSAAAITFTAGRSELLELAPSALDSDPDGWDLEAPASPGGYGDTLGPIGGPPPEGTV